jgi:SSS family transporter
MSSFHWLDYTFFILYLVASVAVGLLFVKEQRTMKDFFLAGRSMGSVIVAISVMAALFSGISFLGAPSEVYQYGLAYGFILFSFFFATPFTTLFLLPFFYRARFITAYHYLEERFSLPVRLLASGLFILRVLFWLGTATYAPALALQQATGLPLTLSILLTGVLTTAYTMMGGMKAVIWTDVMQFFVLFGGQLAIVIVAVMHIPGGFAEVWHVATTHGQAFPQATLDPTVRITWLGVLVGGSILNLVQMGTDQVSIQRYMTAKDLATARRGLWIKLAVTIPVMGLFYCTGAVLRAFYNHHDDPVATKAIAKADQILPYFVVNEMPAGLPGILIAAVFAASMSTISAGLNSLASATMIDFQQRLQKGPLPDDERQILHARGWTLLYGIIVIALAFVVGGFGTLVEATNVIIGLVGGPLLGLLVIGIFARRVGQNAALVGCLAGFALSILITRFWMPSLSFLWITSVGAISTLIVGLLCSLIWKGRPPESLRGLVWENSMLGNEEVRDRE